MAMFDRRVADAEEAPSMMSECKCKFRGTPEDYPDSKMPVDKSHGHCEGSCECETKRSIVEDMTFGQLVGLVNRLLKEVYDLKEQVHGGQELHR